MLLLFWKTIPTFRPYLSVRNILKQAVSQKADMIIIGTHGKKTQGKILLGSVAEQVLRAAHCPVLVTNLDN